MGELTVRTNTLAASGSTHLYTVPAWKECRYGDAKDRDAKCILRLDMDSPALPYLQASRVLTLLTDEPATPIREYRIPHRADTWESAEAVITAVPLIQDLNRILVTTIIGGLPTQIGAFNQLLLADVIDTYILPSLAAYGVTWIERGTISDTRRRSLAFNNATCLGLIDQFVEGTEYWVRLVPRYSGGALVAYQITVTNHNGSATKPRFFVGGNVEALTRQIDGVTQASVIIPQGAVPAGGDRPSDIGEYGVEITAVPNSTQVTVADPEGSGSPIRFTDQHDGMFLEKICAPRLVWPEDASPALNPSATVSAYLGGLAHAVTPNTIWVAAGNSANGLFSVAGEVYVYDINLGVLIDRITVGIGPRGLVYDPATNKIIVACEGDDEIWFFDATTRVPTTPLALTAGDTPRWLALASSTGDVYVTCPGNNQIRRVDPGTEAVVSSVAVTLTVPGKILYASGPDRLYVLTNTALIQINPSSLATSSVANSNGRGIGYDSDDDELWVTGTATTSDIRIFDATAFTVTETLAALFGASLADEMRYDPSTGKMVMTVGRDVVYMDATSRIERSRSNVQGFGSTFQTLNGPIDERMFLCTQTPAPAMIITLVPATESFSVRRAITASDPATQRETIGSPTTPFAVGDRVFYRKDAAGTLVTTISDPAVVAAMAFPREVPVSAPMLRTEHNYAPNTFLRDTTSAIVAPSWDRTHRSTGNPETERKWSSRDASAWTSFNAQADGAHSAGATTLNLKGMTTGDVLEPGDSIYDSFHVVSRAVVDGAGKASVKITPLAGLPGGYSDGQIITIRRSGITNADWYVSGQGAVLPFDIYYGPCEDSVRLAVPYLPSRTSLWCAVEVAVWRQFFNPTQHMRFEARQNGLVLTSATIQNEDVLYTDHAVKTYLLAIQLDVTAPLQLHLALMITQQIAVGAAYIKRIWATLGPELVQTPAIEENANGGQLYHLGLAKAVELSNPGISYQVEALDDDPQAPVVEGAYAFLQDPEFGVAATPRIIAVERFLELSRDTAEPRKVIVSLSNRARDLTGMLLDIASGNVSVVVNQSSSTVLPLAPAPTPVPGTQPPPVTSPPPTGTPGGVSRLQDLTDVDDSSLLIGNVPKWDPTTSKFVTTGAVRVAEEGVQVLETSDFDFVGDNVTVTDVGGIATVTVEAADPLDPSLGLPANLHRLAVVTPIMESATITSFGRILTPTAVGSPGFSSEASGSSFQAGFHRPTRETTTAADQSAGWLAASANKICWRGDGAGRGGFTVVMRFSFDTLPASTRAFIGLYGTAADPTLTAEPSAKVDLLGVGWDSSDSNLQFIHNDGSGTATKVSLGVAPAVAVVYELVLIQPPNGGDCIARLYSITGAGATLIQQSTLTTNLPTTTVFLAPCQNINTAAGGSALKMCFHGWTLDSL